MIAAQSPPSTERSAGRSVMHLLAVVALFLLLGPLVGGIVVIVGLGVWMVPSSPTDALFVILAMMLYGLWISYVMGAVPALLAGLAVGVMDAFRGGANLAFAVALGAAMGAGWSMMTLTGAGTEQIVIHLLIGLACIVATIVCWFATRWRVRT